MSASLHTAGAATAKGYARWLIKVSDEHYYVSDSFPLTRTATEYTLDNLSSVSWYEIVPGTSMTSIGKLWTSPEFTSIATVGLWIQLIDRRTNLTGDQSAFGRIESFWAEKTDSRTMSKR
jgi:hypothetical protein